MKKIKGFSYNTETDIDVIEHIKNQPHEANYIIELIRADMTKHDNKNIEDLVKKYVKEYCKNMNVKESSSVEIKMNSVMDLLNLGK